MNKDVVKEIIYIIIAILLGVLAVKFVIWLLPIIFMGIIAHYIYKSIKKNKTNTNVSVSKYMILMMINSYE